MKNTIVHVSRMNSRGGPASIVVVIDKTLFKFVLEPDMETKLVRLLSGGPVQQVDIPAQIEVEE